MESIQLTYPSTQQGQTFMMDHNPSSVKKWLAQLTFTDINKSLEQLLQTTKTLNRTEQKLNHREENLKTLDQGYLLMSRHFRQHNDKRQVITTDQQLKQLSRLTSEMAYGYKRIVHELAEQSISFKKQTRLAQAINQAQHYLGLHLIEHYQQYSPIPSYIWHELHKLYHFAEYKKLHQIKHKHLADSLQALVTIEESYKRNCLMSVITPYHVEGNQHWHLFKYFYHWSHKATLLDNLKQYSDSECFIINLTGGKRPEYAASEFEYEENSQYRLLMTADLLDELNKQLEHFEKHHQLPKLAFYPAIDNSSGYKLLQQIYAYCDHHIERQDARYPTLSNVYLVWGLTSTIKVLASQSKSTQVKLGQIEARVEARVEDRLKTILGKDYTHQINWQAVNYSSGGLCIRHPKQDVSQLSVGNLVLLKRSINEQPQKSWQAGIVRWLNGNRTTGATMGIEYLHGQKKFAYYLTKNNYGDVIKHQVLLISPFDNHKTLLLAPKNLLGNRRTIKLEYDSQTIEHNIISTEEANSLLAIFTISRNPVAVSSDNRNV